MKRIILSLSALIVMAFAGSYEDGCEAYINKNYKKAAQLFQVAAKQGDTFAQTFLAFMYCEGLGVRQSYAKGVELYQEAAAQGDNLAIYKLGLMYLRGLGVRQNTSKAKELFGKACNNGYNDGCSAYAALNKQISHSSNVKP